MNLAGIVAILLVFSVQNVVVFISSLTAWPMSTDRLCHSESTGGGLSLLEQILLCNLEYYNFIIQDWTLYCSKTSQHPHKEDLPSWPVGWRTSPLCYHCKPAYYLHPAANSLLAVTVFQPCSRRYPLPTGEMSLSSHPRVLSLLLFHCILFQSLSSPGSWWLLSPAAPRYCIAGSTQTHRMHMLGLYTLIQLCPIQLYGHIIDNTDVLSFNFDIRYIY